jgi:pyruvate formate lyase activating enzyme
MRCGYCHNPELVKSEMERLPIEQVTRFIESRSNLLDGVVLSGGECTLSSAILEFLKYLKSLNLKIKIDTNGTNPSLLEHLMLEKLVDFIALDFKAPEAKFSSITGFSSYATFYRSLTMLCSSDIDLEVRTTVHRDLLDEGDINEIIAILQNQNFHGTYAIQKFRASRTLGNLMESACTFDVAKLTSPPFKMLLRNFH